MVIEAFQEMEYVVVVARGHGFAVHEPGHEILIALVDQGFITVEGVVIHGFHMGIGEPTEDDVGLAAAPITASVDQTLFAYGDRFRHDNVLSKVSFPLSAHARP